VQDMWTALSDREGEEEPSFVFDSDCSCGSRYGEACEEWCQVNAAAPEASIHGEKPERKPVLPERHYRVVA
jgi:hypothetical protein